MDRNLAPGYKPNPWSQIGVSNNLFPKDGNNDKSLEEDEFTFFPPVFIFNNACPRRVTNLDICRAACIVGKRNVVVAAQRFGPIWHIYPNSLEARALLLVKKRLVIGDKKNIEIFSKNPSHLVDEFGRALPATKLFIDKAPVIMSQNTIKESLISLGVKPRSALKYERLLDRDETITAWLSNRRYMFIDIPEKSLPVNIEIDNHPIQLFYREQVRDGSDNRQGGQTAVRINTNGGQAHAPVPNPGSSEKSSTSGNNAIGDGEIEPGEIIEDENDFVNTIINNKKDSNEKDSQSQDKTVTIDLTLPTKHFSKCPVSPRKDDLQKGTSKAPFSPKSPNPAGTAKGKKGKKDKQKGKGKEPPIESIWDVENEQPIKGGKNKNHLINQK